MNNDLFGTDITIAPKRRTLATMPTPSWQLLGDRPPWQIISAAVLGDLLDLDRGLLGVWRQRRLGPQALPADWFKGHALGYRVADIWQWLAERTDQPVPTLHELVARWSTEVAKLDDLEPEMAHRVIENMAREQRTEGVKLTAQGQAMHWRWVLL